LLLAVALEGKVRVAFIELERFEFDRLYESLFARRLQAVVLEMRGHVFRCGAVPFPASVSPFQFV